MFGLAREERKVILFLITIALVGIGLNFLLKKYPSTKTTSYFSHDIGKIDLNKADKDLLMSVPGIGEKLAKRIIEYRDEHSVFENIEELKNIKGITDFRFEKIKDSVYVEP